MTEQEIVVPVVYIAMHEPLEHDELAYRRRRTRCAGCGARLPTCFMSDHAPGCSGDAGTIEVSDRQIDAAMMAVQQAKPAAEPQGSAP